MNFSEQPPSKQWAALKYKGEKIAEVWLKPEGDPLALTFRVPQKSFQIPGVDQLLTVENLLSAVSLATNDVESWRLGEAAYPGRDSPNPEWRHPLPPPLPDVAYLTIYVPLKRQPLRKVRCRRSPWPGGRNSNHVGMPSWAWKRPSMACAKEWKAFDQKWKPQCGRR